MEQIFVNNKPITYICHYNYKKNIGQIYIIIKKKMGLIFVDDKNKKPLLISVIDT